MKLTPTWYVSDMFLALNAVWMLTQRLNVVLVPAALDVLDHQARLADLGITDHADLDDDRRILLSLRTLAILIVLALALGGGRSAQAIAVLQGIGGVAFGGV